MNPNDHNYRVIFHPECLNKLEEFGTLEELDPALSEVISALSKNPHAFKASPQYPMWRVAITRRHRVGRRLIPSLRLYVVINEEEKRVLIVDVMINPDDPTIRM